jgi:toxin CptA
MSPTFLAAAVLAGLMGFAIQRGSTCTVAAVDEVVSKRRLRRLTSLLEAAAWVAGGLLVAQALGVLGRMPAGHPSSHLTVLGGVLLGLGAYVNGACVFGAIARLGSGEWAFVATPVGFYLGCLGAGYVFPAPAHPVLSEPSPVLQAPHWIIWLFLAFVAWRLGRPLLAARPADPSAGLAAHAWSPHAATTVIGIAFLFLLLLAGAWAYTDVLAELARGMTGELAGRSALFAALLAGAMLGGWTAGRFRDTRIAPVQLAKCVVGGVLMGWGTLLIPGGNDALVLVGLPLAWPYAWIAFLTMCATIGVALLAGRIIARVASQAGIAPTR